MILRTQPFHPVRVHWLLRLAAPCMLALPASAQSMRCADANGDGVVNNFDIDVFVQAIADPETYIALHGAEAWWRRNDINGDLSVNNFDIDGFVDAISRGGCQDRLVEIRVTTDRRSYNPGDAVTVCANWDGILPTDALYQVEFILGPQTPDGDGPILVSETHRVDSAAEICSTFSVAVPGMIDAVAIVRSIDGEPLAADGASFGVRFETPDSWPEEILALEPVAIDVAALSGQLADAAMNGQPILLPFLLPWYLTIEATGESVFPPEFREVYPTLRAYRGELADGTSSEVRITIVDGLVWITLFTEDNTWVLEPAVAHDPTLPPDLHLRYSGSAVWVPASEDADYEDPPLPLMGGRDLDTAAAQVAGGWESAPPAPPPAPATIPCLPIRVWFDNLGRVNQLPAHVNNIAGLFWWRAGTQVLVVGAPLFYNSNTPQNDQQLLWNFRTDTIAAGFFGDPWIDLLFSHNFPFITYNHMYGRAWRMFPGAYTGDDWAYGWVRMDGSAYRVALVGCHELTHNLGGSLVFPSAPGDAHNPFPTRRTCRRRIFGFCVSWRRHYSLMNAGYINDGQMDAQWHSVCRNLIRHTLTTTPGHFCFP